MWTWNLLPICSHLSEGFILYLFLHMTFIPQPRAIRLSTSLCIILFSLKLYPKSTDSTRCESDYRSVWSGKQRRPRRRLWNHIYLMFCWKKKNPERRQKFINRGEKNGKRLLSLRWKDVRFSRHWRFSVVLELKPSWVIIICPWQILNIIHGLRILKSHWISS